MNFKKAFFLFLALLLPIAVFLFLKGFGKNEFNVAPLFQDTITKPADCSAVEYKVPFVVSDSVLNKLSWNEDDSLTLIVFNDPSITSSKKQAIQMERLRNEFPNKLPVIPNAELPMMNCIFLLKPSDNAVLIDSKRRIRGQYNLTDLDEADRLIMEVKIILKEY